MALARRIALRLIKLRVALEFKPFFWQFDCNTFWKLGFAYFALGPFRIDVDW